MWLAACLTLSVSLKHTHIHTQINEGSLIHVEYKSGAKCESQNVWYARQVKEENGPQVDPTVCATCDP